MAKKSDLLVLSPDYLKKAGIELSNKPDAAAQARSNLTLAKGIAGYIPQNEASDTVIQIMDYARKELNAGESSIKQACIALASVDMAKGYELANDGNGKAYTSMLAFAMDVMPNLAKSTVAGYLAVGRNIYVPAINNRFGRSSSVLLELPPSTLDALKSNLSTNVDKLVSDATIEALKEASKKGKVTQRLAKGISKVIRDAQASEKLETLKPADIVKAAKNDAAALKLVYGEKESRTGGATANGGNAQAQEAKDAQEANTDKYNAIKAKLIEYIAINKGEHGYTMATSNAENTAALCGFLRKAMLSSDNSSQYICRALAELLESNIK